jgi:hypothetical protein
MTYSKEDIEDMTYDEAKEVLAKAVAIRGRDFVYPEDEKIQPTICSYTREVDGNIVGSCVVGVALIDVLGFDGDALVGNTFAANTLLDKYGYTVKDEAVRTLFSVMQWKQDLGKPWGESFDLAIKETDDFIASRAAKNVDTPAPKE